MGAGLGLGGPSMLMANDVIETDWPPFALIVNMFPLAARDGESEEIGRQTNEVKIKIEDGSKASC